MGFFTAAAKRQEARRLSGFDNGTPTSSIANYIKVEEQLAEVHKTVIKLKDLPLTVADATVGVGQKIFDFPNGQICILGARMTINTKTTSVLASTLNASKTLSAGVGTTTQANGTLTTTEQNIVNACAPVSSAVINEDGTAANGLGPAAPALYDGTSTRMSAFLNIGVPTATDIDANATIEVDAEIEITWLLVGDH